MRKGTKLFGNYLEEYKIVKHIADGGNSQVYKVENHSGEIFALKILNAGISKEKIKRFKNEINFCIKYEHINIIKIMDNGITDDKKQIFYIMPYHEKTLRTYIKENHSGEEMVRLFIELLNGVCFFHNKGIIHRDIKPENILLSDENLPIITDFGIAHFSEDGLITQIETKIGSKLANFQYAAPEQREKNEIITKKADIYALGLIFNEMFTKKIPYGNSYMKISDVDKKFNFLDKIIDKMLYQNPDKRYNCVEDIIYEIKVSIELNSKAEEINRLKEIKFLESEEKDKLILEPPKLINFEYDQGVHQILLYLDKEVNNEWINCMKNDRYSEVMGFGPEKFRFIGNIAFANLPPVYLRDLQQIIDYFKTWIDNANKHYPSFIKNKRENEIRRKEEEIKLKIENEERIKKTLEKVHI